jgi:two-component system nitrate/nitrite response regulator NarL
MRVVVIDDHPLFREGVMRTLGMEPDLTIVGEGESADEALQLARTLHPDVLVLDLDIPGGGLDVLAALVAASPGMRVVILTVAASEENLMAALKSGATSYVLKGVSARELAKIVRAASAGQPYVPPELAAGMLTQWSGKTPSEHAKHSSGVDHLTEREQDILQMVSDGQTNREIARALHLAETTVKNSMTAIMQKLNVRNRVEAAILARRGKDQLRANLPKVVR